MFFRFAACAVWAVVIGAPPGDAPQWPLATDDPAGAAVSRRLEQFDRALQLLRDHLQHLKQDVEKGAAGSQQSNRRGEPAFRGVYVMNRDGSAIEFVVGAPGMIANADPQFSNDGRMIAFGGVPDIDAVTQGKIYIYAAEGPFKGSLRDFGYGNTPAWSPDDRQIAYMINDSNPIDARGGTWVMNADGSDRRWVAHAWFPRWSPDGKQLLCHGLLDDGTHTLIIVDLETRRLHTLLSDPQWTLKSYGGNWSPNGKEVLFCGTYRGQDRLAAIGTDGDDASIRILYTNDDPQVELLGPPAWAPDGRQVVFVKQDLLPGPRNWWKSYLYSMSADIPSAPVLLEAQKVGNINRGMAFSPDSKRILFSSER